MIKITALIDDRPSENKALLYEHGLSLLVEKDDVRILFDCGASKAVCSNAYRLGKNLSDLDAVVLSHSHYDHASGYRDLIELGLGSKLLYTGKHFFEPKYAFDGIRYTDLSAGFGTDFLAEHNISHKECEDRTEIAPGIHLIGNFPRKHITEQIPERFVKDLLSETESEHRFVKDDFSDEICMALETEKGILVLVGCSHPGILNMIERVHEQLKQPVYGVLGGTHLVEASRERVEETVLQLEKMGLKLLGMSHCSGEQAEQIIQEKESVMSCHLAAGDTVCLD